MGMNNHDCQCSKCGKTTEEIALKVNLDQANFPSVLDGLFINFNLCDRCLLAVIKSFPLEHQEPILNSGCNTYLSPEDWIRNERGELTDIDKRKMGLFVENNEYEVIKNMAELLTGIGEGNREIIK